MPFTYSHGPPNIHMTGPHLLRSYPNTSFLQRPFLTIHAPSTTTKLWTPLHFLYYCSALFIFLIDINGVLIHHCVLMVMGKKTVCFVYCLLVSSMREGLFSVSLYQAHSQVYINTHWVSCWVSPRISKSISIAWFLNQIQILFSRKKEEDELYF